MSKKIQIAKIQIAAKFLSLPLAWFVGKRVMGGGKKFLVEGYGTAPRGEDCVFADSGAVMLTHRQIEDWEFNTGDGLNPIVSRDPFCVKARRKKRSRKIVMAAA